VTQGGWLQSRTQPPPWGWTYKQPLVFCRQ